MLCSSVIGRDLDQGWTKSSSFWLRKVVFFLVLDLLLHIVTHTTFLPRGFQCSSVIISGSHPLFLVFFFRPPRFLCPSQTLAQFVRWFSYWRNPSNFPRRRCPFARTLNMPFEHFFLFFFSVPSMHLPRLVLPQRGVLCLAGRGSARRLVAHAEGGRALVSWTLLLHRPLSQRQQQQQQRLKKEKEVCVGRARGCSPWGVRAAVQAAVIAADTSRQQDLDLHLRFLRQEPAVSAGSSYLHTLRAFVRLSSSPFFFILHIFFWNICFSLCGCNDVVRLQHVVAF